MKDLEIYSYLIFILLYLLYNFFVKSKEVKQQQPKAPNEDRGFEDIFREIMGDEEGFQPVEIEEKRFRSKHKPENSENTERWFQTSDDPITWNEPEPTTFKPHEEDEELKSHYPIIEEIRNGEFDLKNAIIITEILQRPRYVYIT